MRLGPLLLAALAAAAPVRADDRPLVVGSKNFPESYLLGEIMAQRLEDAGFRVERKFGLAGTLYCFPALENGGIDLYAEYSGTLERVILKLPGRPPYPELQRLLRQRYGMELLEPLGLNNSYALTMRRSEAARRGIRKISDLTGHPGLRYGFTPDFLNRADGWPGLAKAYGLTATPEAMEHSLSYRAIVEGKIDVTDAYTTDGEIVRFDMVVLEDDRSFFPLYLGAPLLRGGLDPRVKEVLGALAGKFTDADMQAMNARAGSESGDFAAIATDFLRYHGLTSRDRPEGRRFWTDLGRRTARHLWLTAAGLLAGMAVAIPLGVVVYRLPRLGRPVLYLAGTLQTIPSLALLALMIPLFGVGVKPAIAALFVYALLPILRNTALALFTIDPVIKKVSVGMGLTTWQRLRYVELPLAVPTILGGVKTAAVINIGTATLAAFIGAGGLGEPIAAGLAINDQRLILEGAIPAALLAIATELAFELLERLIVPRHLLQKPAE